MFGTSVANRVWFAKDKFAFTLRAGYLTNPSRYLALPPTGFTYAPGAGSFSTSFPDSGSTLQLTEYTATFDYMPVEEVTFRLEAATRTANVPYFAGSGGTTSASGFQNPQPGGAPPPGYSPDLRTSETRVLFAGIFRM